MKKMKKKSIIQFLMIGFVVTGLFSSCAAHIERNIFKNYPALDSSPPSFRICNSEV